MAFFRKKTSDTPIAVDTTVSSPASEQLVNVEHHSKQTLEALLSGSSAGKTADTATVAKKEKNRTRQRQVIIRFSDGEYARLSQNVEQSGMNQSEYIRYVALNGAFPQDIYAERKEAIAHFQEVINTLTAELGRQKGMVRSITGVNQDKKDTDPVGWKEVVLLIRFLEKYNRIFKDRKQKIAESNPDPNGLQILCEEIEGVIITAKAKGILLRDTIQPPPNGVEAHTYSYDAWRVIAALCQQTHDQYETIIGGLLRNIDGYSKAQHK